MSIAPPTAAANSPTPNVRDVRNFWETNPLWTGATDLEPGSKEFFEEHRTVVIEDCLGGTFDERIVPDPPNRKRVLDLGCGPGFWLPELARRGCRGLVAADLTSAGLALARERCRLYDVAATFCQQNAERLALRDGAFTHVNCQGVIHHTPDTEACVGEIARVLEPGGTAGVSVYYRNVFLRAWPVLRPVANLFAKAGAQLSGRGREHIYRVADTDEIVRLYDGAANPVGKSYSRQQFLRMVEPYFHVEALYLHFFPARTLPFPLPRPIHRWLDAHAGFLIYANLRKR